MRRLTLVPLLLLLTMSLAAFTSPAGGEPPPELTVETVPPLPGVDMTVYAPCDPDLPPGTARLVYCPDLPPIYEGTWHFSTDEQGRGSVTLPRNGLYYLRVEDPPPAQADLRAAFSRWQDEVFTNLREVEMQGDQRLVAGLDLTRPVRFQYVGPGGERVDSQRVQVVELRSSVGSVNHLPGAGRHWLPAEHILNRDSGLESVPIVYALQRMEIDGSNVVNRGQQRFTAEPGMLTWRMDTLLYSAEILGRDALFGFPLGRGVELEYPDGTKRHFPYEGPDGVKLEGLARGTYRMKITGSPGVAFTSIMALSRDQHVRPVVLSLLDFVVLGAGGALLSLGLLFLGRPHLIPGPLGPDAEPTPSDSRTA